MFGRVSKVVNSLCYDHKPSQHILTEVKLVACYREVPVPGSDFDCT